MYNILTQPHSPIQLYDQSVSELYKVSDSKILAVDEDMAMLTVIYWQNRAVQKSFMLKYGEKFLSVNERSIIPLYQNTFIASCYAEKFNVIGVFDLEGSLVKEYTSGYNLHITRAAIVSNNRIAYIGGPTIYIHDIQSGREIKTLVDSTDSTQKHFYSAQEVEDVIIAPKDGAVKLGYGGGLRFGPLPKIFMWNTVTYDLIHTVETKECIYSWVPLGYGLIIGNCEIGAIVLNIESGEQVFFYDHRRCAATVLLDSRTIVTGGTYELKVWGS